MSSAAPDRVPLPGLDDLVEVRVRRPPRPAAPRPVPEPSVPLWADDEALARLDDTLRDRARAAEALDRHGAMLQEIGATPLAELAALSPGTELLVAGRRIDALRGGSFVLDDGSGCSTVTLPKEAQLRVGAVISRADLLLVACATRRMDGAITLHAANAWDLDALGRDWASRQADDIGFGA